MHCTLPRKPFALGQRRHHLQAVAEDHAVRPVCIVLVELGPRFFAGQSVEVGEEIELWLSCTVCAGLCPPLQVVNQNLGMDLLLDVERRRGHNQVGPVLLVLAAPDQLRIEVAIAALIGNADRRPFLVAHHGLVLGGGNVLARSLVVGERFDDLLRLLFCCRLCHRSSLLRNLGSLRLASRTRSSG